jgi:hypothetical protein
MEDKEVQNEITINPPDIFLSGSNTKITLRQKLVAD